MAIHSIVKASDIKLYAMYSNIYRPNPGLKIKWDLQGFFFRSWVGGLTSKVLWPWKWKGDEFIYFFLLWNWVKGTRKDCFKWGNFTLNSFIFISIAWSRNNFGVGLKYIYFSSFLFCILKHPLDGNHSSNFININEIHIKSLYESFIPVIREWDIFKWGL